MVWIALYERGRERGRMGKGSEIMVYRWLWEALAIVVYMWWCSRQKVLYEGVAVSLQGVIAKDSIVCGLEFGVWTSTILFWRSSMCRFSLLRCPCSRIRVGEWMSVVSSGYEWMLPLSNIILRLNELLFLYPPMWISCRKLPLRITCWC